MDIDYLLDESGFGTSFVLDTQKIGNITLLGKALNFILLCVDLHI